MISFFYPLVLYLYLFINREWYLHWSLYVLFKTLFDILPSRKLSFTVNFRQGRILVKSSRSHLYVSSAIFKAVIWQRLQSDTVHSGWMFFVWFAVKKLVRSYQIYGLALVLSWNVWSYFLHQDRRKLIVIPSSWQ